MKKNLRSNSLTPFPIIILDKIPNFKLVRSKRGTTHIFYDGNTFTPNEKINCGKRTWKCTLYYKQNCKARLTTFTGSNNQTTVRAISAHSHPKVYNTAKSIECLFNYK
jgi:FLYWCH zinc finger domain